MNSIPNTHAHPHHLRLQSILMILFILFYAIFSLGNAKAIKYAYKGEPEDLNDSLVTVPDEFVAHSEYVYINKKIDSTEYIEPNSLFFIIDHSGSMCFNTHNNNDPQDRWGNRYTVTSAFIDSLYLLSPKSEVGLAVFRQYLYLNENDHDFVDTLHTEPYGGYVPFLQLDSLYLPIDKKGYEILKDILKTNIITDPFHNTFHPHEQFADLKYRPQDHTTHKTATNINAGFAAAKFAFQTAQNVPRAQHIIFFSDGKANFSTNDSINAYIEGTDVPTTFTVFFTKDGKTPQSLITMTENIQNNGYSSKNPISDLWAYYNTTPDKLIAFLSENIMKKIINVVTLTPKTMAVNAIDAIDPWDGKRFIFPDLFALNPQPTDFALDFTYAMQSINTMGDTVNHPDTSFKVNFSVVVKPSISLPPEYESLWWDRKIEFFYQGSNITTVSDTMNEIEIRFEPIEGDTRYEYTNVSLELSNRKTQKLDLEAFPLTKKNDYFHCTIKRSTTDPKQFDTTVQHHPLFDTIYAVFRNPKLPLDTLVACIPFNKMKIPQATQADYYDTNGDGVVDTVKIHFDTELDPVAKWITVDILWKDENIQGNVQDFNIDKNDRKVLVTSVEQIFPKIMKDKTSGSMEATIHFVIDSSIQTFPVSDKAAPVITRALYSYNSSKNGTQKIVNNDTLKVYFSESVNPLRSIDPFEFITKKNKIFTMELTPIEHEDNKAICAVDKIHGIINIQPGDSIWIDYQKLVSDGLGNLQSVKDNKRVELEIVYNFGFAVHVIGPVHPKTYKIPQALKVGDITNGIPIVLDPHGSIPKQFLEDIQISFAIYDAVANNILIKRISAKNHENLEMGIKKIQNEYMIVLVWSGKNKNNRFVSEASYVALLGIFKSQKEIAQNKIIIPVKHE